MAKPRHTQATPDFGLVCSNPNGIHYPDDFMARNKRQFRIGQISVDHVQIGTADRAGFDS